MTPTSPTPPLVRDARAEDHATIVAFNALLARETEHKDLDPTVLARGVAAALADSADLHPREVVHELGSAVLRATGNDLKDDATMVCLDWYGGPPRERRTEYGADPERASAPGTAARTS